MEGTPRETDKGRERGREGGQEDSGRPSPRVSQGPIAEVWPQAPSTPGQQVVRERREGRTKVGHARPTCPASAGSPLSLLSCKPQGCFTQWVGFSPFCRKLKKFSQASVAKRGGLSVELSPSASCSTTPGNTGRPSQLGAWALGSDQGGSGSQLPRLCAGTQSTRLNLAGPWLPRL